MKLLICPFDHTGIPGVTHTGLHISSLNTNKVLVAAGIDSVMYPIVSIFPSKLRAGHNLVDLIAQHSPTQVVTCAFWAPVSDFQKIATDNPHVTFAVNCHSNIAFLQCEPGGLTLARGLVDLEMTSHNFHLSGNSRGFVESVEASWEAPCAYLPNLYFLDGTVRESRLKWSGGTLRIGAFGALRPLKNPTVSAFAALEIATNLGTDLEFYINVGRNDGWGDRTLQAVRAIVSNLPYAKLIEQPWQDWPAHRRLVRHMHLLLQPSFTESFNLITADGAAEGIPSVVSDSIEWAPRYWKADPDNAHDVARVGLALIANRNTGRDGLHALARNNMIGVEAWKSYLGV
jgi:hypothetical protein